MGRDLPSHRRPPRPAVRRPGIKGLATEQLRQAAQQYGQEMIDALVDLARNGREETRVRAIGLLLERAYGRPPQEITGAAGGPIEVRWLSA